jgi:glycosyltransferase involved in cell wall biosynthesis
MQRWISFFATRHDVALLSIPPLRESVVVPNGVTLLSGSRQKPIPILSLLRDYFYLKKAVRTFQPDVVHAHLLIPNAWLAAACGFRPFVLTAWGSDLLLSRGVFQRLNRWAIRHASLNTGDSRELLEKFQQQGAEKQNIDIIQWGVDLERFSPTVDGAKFRKDHRIPFDAQVLISPRILQPLYNIHTIAEAFIQLAERFPRLFLLVSRYRASPEYEAKVRTLLSDANVMDRVRFLDTVTHEAMPKFYRAASVVITAPSSDSTAVTLLETMASGVPVIASNLPSVQEWIRDGENGFLVTPGNTPSLVTAIERILTSSPQRLHESAERNRIIVAERASHQACMMKMEEWYFRLASDTGRR